MQLQHLADLWSFNPYVGGTVKCRCHIYLWQVLFLSFFFLYSTANEYLKLFPQVESAMAMRSLQPQIKAIQEQYAGDQVVVLFFFHHFFRVPSELWPAIYVVDF